jgi:hypothetical protein
VLHFEQRIARQRECSLEKEKGKSARDLAGNLKIPKFLNLENKFN